MAAYSGQTVIFGGLIQKTRGNFSRRVPFVADIPLLGYFFKYDQEFETRSETLAILTPMLVTGEEDLDYVKEVESRRMSWCLADVVEAHGDEGLSGGNGFWGPAVGETIYPDLQPTIENVVIHDSADPIVGSTVITDEECVIGPGNATTPYQAPTMQDPASPVPMNALPSDQPIYEPAPALGAPQTTDGVFLPSPQNATSGLPTPVTIPQASYSRPDPTKASFRQSVYPMPAKLPATAKQAGWIDALEAARSQTPTELNRSSSAATQKPTRLGVNDDLLLSE